jgi:AraC-like DNA-binding protein
VATRLEQQLADTADPEQVRRMLQRGSRGLAGDRRPDRGVEAAARLLTDPGARAARVAQLVGWSQRTLRRRVRAETGPGPKELARVARFQGILARLGRVAAGGESLAEAAASAATPTGPSGPRVPTVGGLDTSRAGRGVAPRG